MFLKVRGIESAFRLIRVVCVAVVLGCLALSGALCWWAMEAVAGARERVYVLACGKAMEALAGDRRENLPVEARDHIREFHTLFFTLDPDEKVITENITRALNLADRSAYRVYKNLTAKGFYSEVLSDEMRERLRVDSIVVDMQTEPFYFRFYGEEKITRESVTVTRELLTEGYLREVSRSDDNPHGFLIERWNIISNNDLKPDGR
jgi:conjugative transposon TraK protein